MNTTTALTFLVLGIFFADMIFEMPFDVSKAMTLIALILLFIDIFVNLPMNGFYRLPGNWTKDTTIITGVLVAFVLAWVITANFSIPIYITMTYILLYLLYGFHLSTLLKRQGDA